MIARRPTMPAVLVLARSPSDSFVLAEVLKENGIRSAIQLDVDSLCRSMTEQAGAAIIAEEALPGGSAGEALCAALQRQPVWSDFPLIIMTTAGATNRHATEIAEAIGPAAQATFIERPVRLATLLSAVRAALQSRERQFEIRDHLVALDRTMAQKNLLLAELSHRVKNTLTLIKSIASQTARQSGSVDQFNAEFSGRLQSLSISHSILTMSNWSGGDLRMLVERILDPFADHDRGRLVVEGEPLVLDPRATQALCMFFHELASNAAKYGALSSPQGRIGVRWWIDGTEGEAVHIEWKEQQGPPVRPASRRGFGSTLIERLVPYELGGTSSLDYAPGGVICTLTIPIGQNIQRNCALAITTPR